MKKKVALTLSSIVLTTTMVSTVVACSSNLEDEITLSTELSKVKDLKTAKKVSEIQTYIANKETGTEIKDSDFEALELDYSSWNLAEGYSAKFYLLEAGDKYDLHALPLKVEITHNDETADKEINIYGKDDIQPKLAIDQETQLIAGEEASKIEKLTENTGKITIDNASGIAKSDIEALFTLEDNFDNGELAKFVWKEGTDLSIANPAYQLVVKAIDKSGNDANTDFTLTITVNDKKGPTFQVKEKPILGGVASVANLDYPNIGTLILNSEQAKTADAQEIKKAIEESISAKDETSSNITYSKKWDEELATFIKDEGKGGILTVEATDEANNKSVFKLYVSVGKYNDEIAPNITVNRDSIFPDGPKIVTTGPYQGTLTIGNNDKVTKKMIQDLFTVTDYWDYAIKPQFTWTPTPDDPELIESDQTYKLTIEASDSGKNKATPYNLEINVQDNTPPELTFKEEAQIAGVEIKDDAISVPLGTVITEEIAEKLATAKDDTDGNLTEAIIADVTQYQKDQVGTYDITFEVSDSAKNKTTLVLKVTVVQN